MEIKSNSLKAGSIIGWKEYSKLRRFWGKITGKDLPFNKWSVLPTDVELITLAGIDVIVYSPIRKYSRQELNKLDSIGGCDVNDLETLTIIINIVRPNTFVDNADLSKCKYYKKINLDEESDKYIHKVKQQA